ncbi:endonuclease MutS2 [Gorillibacterium massiliense]|uniref:endonuclease MutS2 n=1 Tax=Gorillibacterium massiliense TaxID=1280390 RepID=UPI0004B57274|nr:hypothetical protein [Gorillibacterium massiliense]
MNPNTLAKLDYERIKEKLLGYAVTFVGRKHIEQMEPMDHAVMIRRKLTESGEARDVAASSTGLPLPTLTGMEGPLALLGKGYILPARDLEAIAQFIRSCGHWTNFITRKEDIAPTLSAYVYSIHDLKRLMEDIEVCIRQGQIEDMASAELNRIRKRIRTAEERIKRKLDTLLSKYKSSLQETIVSQRNGRYVFAVKKEFRKLVPGAVLDESASGQTVFIEPADLAELQSELAALRAEETIEEEKILTELTGQVEENETELKMNVEIIGHYDFVFAKGKYALSINARVCSINEEGRIHLRQAAHPFLQTKPVPLTIEIGGNGASRYRSLIITGPNTGGKTVALKTVGLLTLMALSGMPIPAAEDSSVPVFSNVEVDIGDNQSMDQSLSTFSSHIKTIIRMLDSADSRTLILIDELATGTDPGEGIGLSIAVLEELYRKGATVIATTHYNEIKQFAQVTPGFENARMEFDLETLRPLYRLTIGVAGSSYAFHIAGKLGISPRIIERARSITNSHVSASLPELPKAVDPKGESTDTEKSENRNKPPITRPNRKAAVRQAEKRIRQEALQAHTGADPDLLPKNGTPLTGGSNGSDDSSTKTFKVGDVVFIPYLKRSGVVVTEEDKKGELIIMVQKQKMKIRAKRLKPFIDRKELYPEDYDMDIVFETKENRKKRHLMSRKHADGVTIITPEQDEES